MWEMEQQDALLCVNDGLSRNKVKIRANQSKFPVGKESSAGFYILDKLR